MASPDSAIRAQTGISRIHMMYVQLLYSCNFAAGGHEGCVHCFHGKRLQWKDAWSLTQLKEFLTHFVTEYQLKAVTYLGGEPFLYPDIETAIRMAAREFGLSVEICTNGHPSFLPKLEAVHEDLSVLRVSLEGLHRTNDRIRQRGSFLGGIRMLDRARELGVETGVTMTVNSLNINEVVPLALLLQAHGVANLKLHCLRLVGNATRHPELEITDLDLYAHMRAEVALAGLDIQVIYDADLSPAPEGATCSNLVGGVTTHLERAEVSPEGALTVSCKAVGLDASAFFWDFDLGQLVYRPHGRDEMTLNIADVTYTPEHA